MEASSDGISERPIIFVVENLRKPRPGVARSLLSTPYRVVAAAHLVQATRMLKLLRQRPALPLWTCTTRLAREERWLER